MIDGDNWKKCTGCEACVQACPVQCITTKDINGFMYPRVDGSKCIKCGKCQRICPVTKNSLLRIYKRKRVDAYVAINSIPVERGASSSGGIFIALAKYVVQQGGCVCGAVWADKYTVIHEIIDNEEELTHFQGSKYIQSKMGNAFCDVQDRLQNKQLVLFSGTACQIAGLKSYLQKDYANLITVDVLCHGVPSPLVWRKHVDWTEAHWGKPIASVNFRTKEPCWNQYSVQYVCEDGEHKLIPHSMDLFMKLFLSNIALRESCYKCQYKGIPHLADLTLGDAWGVDKRFPQFNDGKGISAVFCNTDAGRRLFQQLLCTLQAEKVDVNFVVPPLQDSRKSVRQHPNRKQFLEHLSKQYSYEVLLGDTRMNRIQRMVHYLNRVEPYIAKILCQDIVSHRTE